MTANACCMAPGGVAVMGVTDVAESSYALFTSYALPLGATLSKVAFSIRAHINAYMSQHPAPIS